MNGTADDIRALLVTAKEAAKLARMGLRTWWRRAASDGVPAAVRMGGRLVRWRRADIERWVELGCPDRPTFEASSGKRRAG
jgi:excisionase family DNA binding protein